MRWASSSLASLSCKSRDNTPGLPRALDLPMSVSVPYHLIIFPFLSRVGHHAPETSDISPSARDGSALGLEKLRRSQWANAPRLGMAHKIVGMDRTLPTCACNSARRKLGIFGPALVTNGWSRQTCSEVIAECFTTSRRCVSRLLTHGCAIDECPERVMKASKTDGAEPPCWPHKAAGFELRSCSPVAPWAAAARTLHMNM